MAAKFVFGMNVSLDGYVDHDKFAPGVLLFRHWIEQVGAVTGSLYGRGLYEVMRYFDEDRPEWDGPVREFAEAWRRMPKWVVSHSLTEVGPNATLIQGDLETEARKLKAEHEGRISVGGPKLAASLSALGMIDEYRPYFRPVVLGRGAPFFVAPPPPLKLVAHELIGEDAVRITYVLA